VQQNQARADVGNRRPLDHSTLTCEHLSGRRETHMRRSPLCFFLGILLVTACKSGDETSGSSDSGTSGVETDDPETGDSETESSTTEPEPEPDPSITTTNASTGSDSEEDTDFPDTDTDTETTESGPVCSNGIVEEDEECDDGILSENGPCTPGCLKNICGDGYVWTGVAAFDAGEQNRAYAGSCGEDCTEESVPKCGDGILQQEYEDCEIGDTNQDGVVCNLDQCSWGEFRYVFATSQGFTGDLASDLVNDDDLTGVARADRLCNVLAAGAGLPGEYYAWLSDNNNLAGSDAADRIGGAQDSETAAYVMPNGQVAVATSWAELLNTGPAIAIDRTEDGDPLDPLPYGVWTNTDPSGHSLGESTCNNWTSLDGFGWVGQPDVGSEWTTQGPLFCNWPAQLYCVQGVEK